MEIKQSSARLHLGGQVLDLHYRVSGEGPPLFLLHPSPLSSAFMAPLMRRLAPRVTAIAPDTPGFGESDALAAWASEPNVGLAPYVQAMIALRRALGLKRVAVYGSATGAQIALEWAKADADAVCGLVLDNAASFTDAECERIMDGYFPSMAPAADGSHLARAWQVAHDATLFFPWHRPATARRLAAQVGSPAVMDLTARGYLSAGPGYAAAYRAAFRNERAERAQPIRAPLVIMRWQGSILKPWTDRFDAFDWGDNVRMAHCGPSVEDRWACLESHLQGVLPEASAKAQNLRLDTGAVRYVDACGGQVRYRMPADGPPKGIALHGPGSSSALIETPSGAGWLSVDPPGHGGSLRARAMGSRAPGEQESPLSLAHCVAAVRELVEALEARPLLIFGVGLSERIAEWVAKDSSQLRLLKPGFAGLTGALPDLRPEASGAHLWRAWQWLRCQMLERDARLPDAERLTRMLLALLDAQDAYRDLHDALGSDAFLD